MPANNYVISGANMIHGVHNRCSATYFIERSGNRPDLFDSGPGDAFAPINQRQQQQQQQTLTPGVHPAPNLSALSIDPFPDLGAIGNAIEDFSFENIQPTIGQPALYGNLFD